MSTTLYLGSNNLTSLPPEIGQLNQLTGLDLSSNNLTSLSPEIGQLSQLTSLNLAGNNLTSLPPEIGQLNQLTGLDLSSNNLTSLPPEIGQLSQLTSLNLASNNLTSLPPEIGQLSQLTSLSLRNNPLESPPMEIAEQGLDAIRNYFDELERTGETRYLFESKLLIIGDGGTGKTTFKRKIKDPNARLPADGDTTRGIDVDTWQFPYRYTKKGTASVVNFHVNLWDFGGQELYRGTHQMFFSKKCYYVLIADTRKQGTDFSYWLNTVNQIAGEESSVLILLNEKHGHTVKFDEKGYKGHFGSIIKGVISLDLGKDISKIGDLQEQVKLHLKQLPGIGDALPPSWVKIRDELSTMDKIFISFDDFIGICNKYGVRDSSVIKTLSVYYTRIGVFTHYIDDELLRGKIYLDSNWLLDTVYEILENKDVQEKKGRLTAHDIREIWGKNNLEFEVDRLARLMHKFGLMYQVEDADDYVVPEHLPAKPYDVWPHTGNVLHFVYEFDKYMPPGIMSRLIVALHHHIKNHDMVWSSGVNLQLNNTYAEITESYGAENSFKIQIVGSDKIELLSIIRERFADVLNPFRSLKYKQLLPCSCELCAGSEAPEFHTYDSLLNLRSLGRGSQCRKSGVIVDVNKLLKVTEPKGKNLELAELRPPIAHGQEAPLKKKWYRTLGAKIGGFIIILAAIATIYNSDLWNSTFGWLGRVFNKDIPANVEASSPEPSTNSDEAADSPSLMIPDSLSAPDSSGAP